MPIQLRSRSLATALSLLAVGATLSGAEQPSPAELKLRDTLRTTMLQLRTLQAERDTLQADKEGIEADKQQLTTKLETLTKESAASQATAEKNQAELESKLVKREADNAYLVASLNKWKAAYKQAVTTAEAREAARAKLNSEKIVLQRRVEDQARKNQEMFKLGSEILVRYENFGLGTALTAREPFVGTTRVKLQNLVQDYGDKLAEQRIQPPPAPPKAPETKPVPGASKKPGVPSREQAPLR